MNYRSRLPLGTSESKSFFNSNGFSSPNKRPSHDLSDIENIIDHDRRKFVDEKNSIQGELERERQKRLEFQNKLLRVKEEFSRKQSQILEMEYKLNNTLNQNEDLRMQVAKYKQQLERLQDLYGQKIEQLEEELEKQRINFDDTTGQYNEEFEKFKKEGQDYVDRLTFEYQKKIKTLEDKTKFSDNARRDFQTEIKRLNDTLLTTKINYDDVIREMTLKSRDEQSKKVQQVTKSYQQRLRASQQAKEHLVRKTQDLMRVVQDKQHLLQGNEREKHEQIARLEHQIGDMHSRAQHLTYMLDKANNDAYERVNSKTRSTRDVPVTDQTAQLKQQLDQRRREIQDKNASIRDLKQAMKQSTVESQRRRVDLEQRCSYYQSQSRKYKDQYNKICDTLKSKINQTIASVSTYQRPS